MDVSSKKIFQSLVIWCGFRGVFWVRRDFVLFAVVFCCLRTHTACSKYEDAVSHLPLY